MAYNNFTLDSVKNQFKLNLINDRFCESLATTEPQVEFLTIFDQSFSLAERARTEKAKSELLVSPILVEARRLANERVQLFSGEEFNVDRDRGLNGFCDFLFSRSSQLSIRSNPLASYWLNIHLRIPRIFCTGVTK